MFQIRQCFVHTTDFNCEIREIRPDIYIISPNEKKILVRVVKYKQGTDNVFATCWKCLSIYSIEICVVIGVFGNTRRRMHLAKKHVREILTQKHFVLGADNFILR